MWVGQRYLAEDGKVAQTYSDSLLFWCEGYAGRHRDVMRCLLAGSGNETIERCQEGR